MVSLGEIEVNLPFKTLKFDSDQADVYSYLGTDRNGDLRYSLQIGVEDGCRISIKILPLKCSYSDGVIKTFIRDAVKVAGDFSTGGGSSSSHGPQPVFNIHSDTSASHLSTPTVEQTQGNKTGHKRKLQESERPKPSSSVTLHSNVPNTSISSPKKAHTEQCKYPISTNTSMPCQNVTSQKLSVSSVEQDTDSVPDCHLGVPLHDNSANTANTHDIKLEVLDDDDIDDNDDDDDSLDESAIRIDSITSESLENLVKVEEDELYDDGTEESETREETSTQPKQYSLKTHQLTSVAIKSFRRYINDKDSPNEHDSKAAACDFSRYGNATDDDINKLLADPYQENTKKATRLSVMHFKNYLKCKGLPQNIEDYTADDLDKRLCQFYVNVRKQDGTMYKTAALSCLRFGLARYFHTLQTGIDILRGPQFTKSNTALKRYCATLKKMGLGSEATPIISPDDLKKLYSCGVFATTNPSGLQRKVFFELVWYLHRGVGRKDMRVMMKSNYVICYDGDKKYVTMVGMDGDKTDNINRMYEIPESPFCPVKSFEKYISKLSNVLNNMWQRAQTNEKWTNTGESWYIPIPVGHNTLGRMMNIITASAKLSQQYTNNSIRLTVATHLKLQDHFPKVIQIPASTLSVDGVLGAAAVNAIVEQQKTSVPQNSAQNNMLLSSPIIIQFQQQPGAS